MIDYLFKCKIDIKTFIQNKTETSYKDEVRIDYRDLENLDFEIASNNTLLSNLCLAKVLLLENTTSIIKFDIIWFSSLTDSVAVTIGKKFLTNMVNLEYRSTRDICIRMLEVDCICQIISKQFGFQTRPW